MIEDFHKVEIGNASVHLVYSPISGEKQPPYLTDEIITPNKKTKALFREKVVSALAGNKAISVKSKAKKHGTILRIVKKLQSSVGTNEYTESFIKISKEIALHYSKVIDGRSNDCIILLLEINKGNKIRHSILILELEVGIQAEQKEEKGKRTINLGYIESLILSKNTRLFKIAHLAFEKNYDAIVCDKQTRAEELAARYFMKDFLECNYVRIPRIATKEFYDKSMEFINSIKDGRDKYTSSIHLLSYIQSDENILSASEFARKLNRKYSQGYIDFFGEEEISMEPFQKDISGIKRDLDIKRIQFTNGIALIGPSEQLDKNVNIERIEEDSSKVDVKFRAELKKVGRK